MITLDEARQSFFEYLKLGSELMDRILVTPEANDKVILSWAVFFCSGISCKLTEAFLLGNIDNPHPGVRWEANVKINGLHDLNVQQMRDDGTAWNQEWAVGSCKILKMSKNKDYK